MEVSYTNRILAVNHEQETFVKSDHSCFYYVACDVAVVLSAVMQATQHIIDNLLRHVYHTLKEKERYAKEGSSRTSYEVAMDTINDAFSPSAPLYRPTNSDVESFYRGTTTAEEFVWRMNDYIISKARDRLDGDLNPLLSISWDLYSSVQGRRDTCSNVQKLTGRRLWAVFNKLDTSRESLVDIDDITDVILKLYSSNNRQEDPENIQEWFCNMKQVDFWSFFSALVENHRDLIQGASAVQSLHKVRLITDTIVPIMNVLYSG